MQKVATAKEMQQIDSTTISKYGLAGIVLMERAGISAAALIEEFFFTLPGHAPEREIIVLCGGGNNGGDGLVIARELHNHGRNIRVYLAADPKRLSGDALANYRSAIKFGISISPISGFIKTRCNSPVIVDALLGTGLNKNVRSPLSEVIKKANILSDDIISVDLPSGICSDTGMVMGTAIKASHTVTFGLPKRGHLLYPGAEYSGKLTVRDIGFPSTLLTSEKIMTSVYQHVDAESALPPRPRNSHKGTYGHVLLLAGSKGKTGAALLAARACLASGAGLVTLAAPETVIQSLQSRVTEAMLLPLPDKGDGTVSLKAADLILEFLRNKCTVMAIGPGLSCDEEIVRLMRVLITKTSAPLVIDADGLNALSLDPGALNKASSPIVLTPHPGEMQRLTAIMQDSITTAAAFAKKRKCFVVLKGSPTVTAAPDGRAFLNSSGNPGMSTAGTGDVLTGMLSALIAQGLNPLQASLLSVYMHGRAGDAAAQKKGEHSMIASDLIREIPGVFKSLRKGD
ncbi:MAG: NAD(P)H-hydrate dehydratase [Nitrospira sp.]|nr:NAD(P)H-hydrate dehydratase [bacterium]MBL7031726.1 NAD(P)H-hydrate dehydratase [Nitrospira sp.]